MNILITSGGTSEKIDAVRTITNMSTGKLGAEIANTLVQKTSTNLKIFFLSSNKCALPNKHKRIEVIEITDTQSVLDNMKEIVDRTNIPKAVEIGDFIYYWTPILKTIIPVVETFENVVFNVRKNTTVLNNGRKFVNSEDGLKAMGFTKWIPEVEKFIVIKTSSTNEYEVKRVKEVHKIKKEVTLYDGSTLKFCEVNPFLGKFL